MPISPNTLTELSTLYESEKLPQCTYDAFGNTQKLLVKSQNFKIGRKLQWEERLKSPRRRSATTVRFSDNVYSYDMRNVSLSMISDSGNAAHAEKGTQVTSLAKPVQRKLSDEVDRELSSVPLIEKFLSNIIASNSNTWETQMGGSRESLENELMLTNISFEILSDDLKRILWYFTRSRPAILGYKSSYKFPYEYDEFIFDPRIQNWFKSGRKIAIAPKLRLYLLRVVRDQETAAIAIQSAWRRKMAIKKYWQKCQQFIYFVMQWYDSAARMR